MILSQEMVCRDQLQIVNSKSFTAVFFSFPLLIEETRVNLHDLLQRKFVCNQLCDGSHRGHSSGVERALRMREVWGSIPHASNDLLLRYMMKLLVSGSVSPNV